MQIHNVVHVSQLKKFHGELPVARHIPDWLSGHHVDSPMEPEAMIDRRVIKSHNRAVVQHLVKRKNFAAHETTWEDASSSARRFPDFLP